MDGVNGVYTYSGSPQFPVLTFGDTNYWVDVVFSGNGSPPPPVSVPNVVGLTQTAATTAITGAGLVVGTVTTAPSSTVAYYADPTAHGEARGWWAGAGTAALGVWGAVT